MTKGMISTSYDPEADAVYLRIMPAGTKICATRELEPGLVLDLDAAGRIVGIEVLDVSSRTAAPAAAAE